MENKGTEVEQQAPKANWLSFEEESVAKAETKDIKEPVNEDKEKPSNKENTEAVRDPAEKDDYGVLKQQLENLSKQQRDTQNWGRKQRAGYVLAKKRVEDLAQKMFEDGTLLEDQLTEIKNVFQSSFETEDLKEPVEESSPYKNVIDNLNNTLEEYKKWTSDKDADLKYQAFFKHLELVTPQKLKDIQEYLASEEPKEALKYILENGDKYYNKFYKQAIEKGDAFAYIEELTSKNEKLEKRLKELTEELEQTPDKVYSKSIKSRGSVGNAYDKSQMSKWGDSGNFFDR